MQNDSVGKGIVSGGERIYLRELDESDVTDRYLSWFSDSRVTHFLEAKNLTRREVIDYINKGRENGLYYMYAICLNESDLHIGNLKLGPIDRVNMISDMVTVIGDRLYWGMGIATEAIKLGNKLAFERNRIRKLSAGIYSDNTSSIKAYTKAGWVVEAVLQGQFMRSGKVMDRICIACFNPACFDLKKIRTVDINLF